MACLIRPDGPVPSGSRKPGTCLHCIRGSVASLVGWIAVPAVHAQWHNV
jgi:hypothetical protein